MNGTKRDRAAFEGDLNEPPKKQARNNAYELIRQQLQQELAQCDSILEACDRPKEDVVMKEKEESKEVQPTQIEQHQEPEPETIQHEPTPSEPEPIIQGPVRTPKEKKTPKRKESPKHTRSSSPTSFQTPSSKSKTKEEKESESNSTRRSKRPRKPAKAYDETTDAPQLSNDMKKAKKILDQIFKHKQAWPFLEPVDYVKLNCPDYPVIIKHPMDFGTISQKVADGEYTSFDEFVADSNLVFSNCFLYNPPKTDVVIMAETVKKYFDNKIETYLHESPRRAKTEQKPATLLPEAAATPAAPASATKKASKKEQSMREKKKITTSPIDARDMTYDEKKRLSSNIGKLDADKISKVIEIIASRSPTASSQTDGDEIEIDLDKLDPTTLRQLERFVRSALHSADTKPKKGRKKSKKSQAVNAEGQPSEANAEDDSSDDDDSDTSSSSSDSEDEGINQQLPATLPLTN